MAGQLDELVVELPSTPEPVREPRRLVRGLLWAAILVGVAGAVGLGAVVLRLTNAHPSEDAGAESRAAIYVAAERAASGVIDGQARVQVTFACRDEQSAQALRVQTGAVAGAITAALAPRSVDELLTAAGREQVQLDLLKWANSLPGVRKPHGVAAVYFQEYIVVRDR